MVTEFYEAFPTFAVIDYRMKTMNLDWPTWWPTRTGDGGVEQTDVVEYTAGVCSLLSDSSSS